MHLREPVSDLKIIHLNHLFTYIPLNVEYEKGFTPKYCKHGEHGGTVGYIASSELRCETLHFQFGFLWVHQFLPTIRNR